MPRGMVEGSVASRILAVLADRPATNGGLAFVLRVKGSYIGSSLMQLGCAGKVVAVRSLGDALRLGMRVETGQGTPTRRDARVWTLSRAGVLEKSQANGRAGHANAGLSQRIREALAEGPMTSQQIADDLGVPWVAVKHQLSTLTKITGGVVASGPHSRRVYALFRGAAAAPVDPERPFRRAARIEVGRGSFWGAGLV